MDIKEIKKFVINIEGWLKDGEGEVLYYLAKNCKGNGVGFVRFINF